jgi:hypothetical protein
MLQPEQSYESRANTIQNPDIQFVVHTLNVEVDKLIENQKKAFMYLPSNSPESIARCYKEFFERLMEESTQIDTCYFCDEAIERSKTLSSGTLVSTLQSTLRKILEEKGPEFRINFNQNRRRHIDARQDLSVKFLTFASYSVYINVISSMTQFGPRMPAYVIPLAVLGSIVNHITTEYASLDDMLRGARSVGERVINNANIVTYFNGLYRLTDRAAAVVNRQVNRLLDQGGEDPLAALPNNPGRPRIT